MPGGVLKGLKDLIFPNYCPGCKNIIRETEENSLICPGCWDKIEKNLPPFCASCGRHLNARAIEKNTCASCANEKFYFNRAFSPCLYTGTVKKLIHEFKYRGKDYLGKPLGSLMNMFIKDYRLPVEHLDFIIPMPLHKIRQREREFNQAEILSQQISKEFNMEILTGGLIRSKPTKAQARLALKERLRNMEESFLVAKPHLIEDKNLLLVDDVLTTGATASEAAKSLKESGAKVILLMTLAC